jgi:ACS family pantothenate transporter-like MFS transporter
VTFSGTHLILGSFYEEDMLSFRTAIFTSSGLIGSIFSGFIQAAIYQNMDDYNGIRGWRWLFIVDFLVTIPVVIYGFIFFPDSPEISKPFYFNEAEHQLALRKLKKPRDELNWTLWKRVFGNWRWYFFSFLWVLGGENESFSSNSLFALWLKYFNYPVEQRNHFPMGIYAVGVVATLISAIYLNASGGRYHWRVGIFIPCILFIASILLLSRPLAVNYVFPAHYLSGFAYAGQTVFFAWANVTTQDDLQVRAIILALMNMFSNAVNAWWSLLFYVASDAPKFRKGAIAMIATSIASALVCGAIRFLQLKDERKHEGDALWIEHMEEEEEEDEVHKLEEFDQHKN